MLPRIDSFYYCARPPNVSRKLNSFCSPLLLFATRFLSAAQSLHCILRLCITCFNHRGRSYVQLLYLQYASLFRSSRGWIQAADFPCRLGNFVFCPLNNKKYCHKNYPSSLYRMLSALHNPFSGTARSCLRAYHLI